MLKIPLCEAVAKDDKSLNTKFRVLSIFLESKNSLIDFFDSSCGCLMPYTVLIIGVQLNAIIRMVRKDIDLIMNKNKKRLISQPKLLKCTFICA